MSSITYILTAALLALQATSVLSAHISTLIVGGNDAYPGEYPYQVSILHGVPPLIKPRPVCGGAILTESWVVTSASCINLIPRTGKLQVKAGKHQLEHDSEWVQTVDAPLRLIHSGFRQNLFRAIKPHDIALLKLKRPLRLNNRVQPVALPQSSDFSESEELSGNAILTGWGSVSKNIFPELPDVLQAANVSIISKANCNDALTSVTNNERLTKHQLCTGPLDEEISACVGDSGDPLVQFEEEIVFDEKEVLNVQQKPVLIGITSWAPYPCGQVGSPTVYTEVSPYVEWINSRIEEN